MSDMRETSNKYGVVAPKEQVYRMKGRWCVWGTPEEMLGRSLEFTGVIHVFCIQTWQRPVILDAALLPHIQSINKSCQLYFQNIPGI